MHTSHSRSDSSRGCGVLHMLCAGCVWRKLLRNQVFLSQQCAAPRRPAKAGVKTEMASDFKEVFYLLDHRTGRMWGKIAIFGHKSALGKIWAKRFLRLMIMFVLRKIIYSSFNMIVRRPWNDPTQLSHAKTSDHPNHRLFSWDPWAHFSFSLILCTICLCASVQFCAEGIIFWSFGCIYTHFIL